MKKGSWAEAIFYTISSIIVIAVLIYDLTFNYDHARSYRRLSWEAFLAIIFLPMLTYLIIDGIASAIEKRKSKNDNTPIVKKKKWKKRKKKRKR